MQSLIPGLGRFPWRGAWQAPPVFLPGGSLGQRSLVGYSPPLTKSQTQLKQLSTHTYTLLVIRERQIKTTVRYHFTPTRMTVIRKMRTSAGDNVEKLAPLYFAGMSVEWCSKFGKKFGSFSNANHRVTYYSAVLLLDINLRELKTFVHMKIYKWVFILALFIIPQKWKP